MVRKGIAALAAVTVLSILAAVGTAGAHPGPPSIAAGPAFGFVPAQSANSELAPGASPSDNANPAASDNPSNAARAKPGPRVSLLQNHGGPVQSAGT